MKTIGSLNAKTVSQWNGKYADMTLAEDHWTDPLWVDKAAIQPGTSITYLSAARTDGLAMETSLALYTVKRWIRTSRGRDLHIRTSALERAVEVVRTSVGACAHVVRQKLNEGGRRSPLEREQTTQTTYIKTSVTTIIKPNHSLCHRFSPTQYTVTSLDNEFYLPINPPPTIWQPPHNNTNTKSQAKC